jgi:phosphomannomutase
MSATSAKFLDYTPVSLAFGTSGLRGLVKDITDLESYINVKGALRYFLDTGDVRPGGSVVLAGDLRPSTDRIMRASARAILDSGCSVENAGKIPTPALILRAIASKRPGVMVSGSHIPFDRNGIKLNKSTGEILKSDEPGILREVERVRSDEYGRSASESAFTTSGMLKTTLDLPSLDRSAEESYLRRYTASFAKSGLSGLRVLVYEHSAVGRDLLGRILRDLGAEVVPAGRAETFVPIDTENITPELLDRLEQLVASAERSETIDVIVSTDGDSDRPLVAAVSRRNPADPQRRRVRFLSGDLLGIVASEYLKANAVVVPISANDAIERRMAERGILLRKTKIGSPYVIAAIDELRRDKPDSNIVGWEANGGFLVGTDLGGAESPLHALPTRDSTLPILANLYAGQKDRIGLSALWDGLPARFGHAGLLDEFPVAASRAILAHLIPEGGSTEVLFDGPGVIADSSAMGDPAAGRWRTIKATLARFFTPALGFDDIHRINVLDGVRMYFANGDVAHIRPSGNAPQLRIYANADSQARADAIVESGLHEPDGILRQLEKAFS